MLDQLAFAYHFYGHTGEAYWQNLADNGITQSVKIKELEFDRLGKLSEGCMLILEVEQKKGAKQFTLSPVPLNEIFHFMQDNLAVLLMRKGRIENPSFCYADCFSGSLHYSRLPENSFLK